MKFELFTLIIFFTRPLGVNIFAPANAGAACSAPGIWINITPTRTFSVQQEIDF